MPYGIAFVPAVEMGIGRCQASEGLTPAYPLRSSFPLSYEHHVCAREVVCSRLLAFPAAQRLSTLAFSGQA